MAVVFAKNTRDPKAEIARYPVQHLIDCPASYDDDLAAEHVEHYATRRRTDLGRGRDVNEQLPTVPVMVAHCCLCGGMSYHDIRSI